MTVTCPRCGKPRKGLVDCSESEDFDVDEVCGTCIHDRAYEIIEDMDVSQEAKKTSVNHLYGLWQRLES